MERNIFIVALEEKQKAMLESLHQAKEREIYSLLVVNTAVEAKQFSFNDILATARETLFSFPASIDTIFLNVTFLLALSHPYYAKSMVHPHLQ